jgi:hypothetical protein
MKQLATVLPSRAGTVSESKERHSLLRLLLLVARRRSGFWRSSHRRSKRRCEARQRLFGTGWLVPLGRRTAPHRTAWSNRSLLCSRPSWRPLWSRSFRCEPMRPRNVGCPFLLCVVVAQVLACRFVRRLADSRWIGAFEETGRWHPSRDQGY